MPYPLDDNGNIRVDFVWGNVPMQPDEQRTDDNADWNDNYNQPGDRGWTAPSQGATSDTLNTTYDQGLSVGDKDGANDSWDDVTERLVVVPSTHDIIKTGYNNYPAYIPDYSGDGDTGLEAVVPNVFSMTDAEARAAIEGAGFVYASQDTYAGATLDNNATVKVSSPVAGATPNAGSTVTVTFFNAPEVPNLLNLTEAAATTALTNVSLVKGAVTTANNAAGATALNDGKIKTQSIAAGTTVNTGTSVALVKYAYVAETVAAPDVVGLTEAAATTALTNVGLVKGTVTTANNAAGATSENDGTIKTQTPAAGTTVNTGSSVDLVKYAYETVYTTGPIAGFNRNSFSVSPAMSLNGDDAIMYLTGQTVKPVVGDTITVTGSSDAMFNRDWTVAVVQNDNSYNTGGTAVKITSVIPAEFTGVSSTGGTWTKI
jgi:hypothetical protein